MTRHELILYATPTGPLAAACDHYFRAACRLGPTEAQAYPPHCTLTGFFHRLTDRREAIARKVAAGLERSGPVPVDAVTVERLTGGDAWVGLELTSPYLESLTASLVAGDRLDRGDDEIRLKHQLHVSLAYGCDDLRPYWRLAKEVVDPAADAGWEVALWERWPDGGWMRFD